MAKMTIVKNYKKSKINPGSNGSVNVYNSSLCHVDHFYTLLVSLLQLPSNPSPKKIVPMSYFIRRIQGTPQLECAKSSCKNQLIKIVANDYVDVHIYYTWRCNIKDAILKQLMITIRKTSEPSDYRISRPGDTDAEEIVWATKTSPTVEKILCPSSATRFAITQQFRFLRNGNMVLFRGRRVSDFRESAL